LSEIHILLISDCILIIDFAEKSCGIRWNVLLVDDDECVCTRATQCVSAVFATATCLSVCLSHAV